MFIVRLPVYFCKSWRKVKFHCLSPLIGKIAVIKCLIIPHILQLASVVTFSDKLISEMDKLL